MICRRPDSARSLPLSLLVLLFLGSSCSLKKMAVSRLSEVLAESEVVYRSDEDPELVAEALPFNLKTIETLLVSSPDHRGLLLSATTGFTFYAYGFVEPEAYQRALQLSRGSRCSTWLLWAENVSVAQQDVREFEELLDKVISFDVDAFPEDRLLNILAQQRARWLRGRVDELFLVGQ